MSPARVAANTRTTTTKPNGSPSNDFDRNRFATGPTGPPLRANPSPEVTDRICRLPLSTFVYRQESPQLGDLMRISVRPVRVSLPPLSVVHSGW